jgi:hypothetical protein
MIILCVSIIDSHSQTVIVTSGNTIKNTNNTLEYSIGQIAIETIITTDNKLTQGVLQPSLKVSVQVNEEFDKKYWFKIFPNPSNGIINIQTNYTNFSLLNIYDIEGRIISSISYNGAPIDISKLTNGTYLVQLVSKDNFKTFQIIKQ